MRLFFLIFLFFVSLTFKVFGLTAEEIVNRVDENMTFNSARFSAKMIIHVGDEVRVKELVIYGSGKNKSYAEFLAPPRDRGIKYLKIGDNLWMYLPEVDKTIKIAGHMLRQSMMGSDFSYEDALESSKLLEKYSVKLDSEEKISATFIKNDEKIEELRSCYVLELTAKVKNVTYFKRKIWVDKEYFVPLKVELFALSGKKLKLMTLSNICQFGERFYPLLSVLKNLLRQNSKTEFIITKAEFDIEIPENFFSINRLTK